MLQIGRAMAKRRLYLHIGAHRTATTSLQAFLASHRPHLAAHGFLYAYGVRRHVALANDIFAGRRQAAEVAAEIAAQADAMETPVHSVILSDEDICKRPDLTPFAGLTDHFDVTIVYSLRRQDLWLESWFLQNVKWQWDKTFGHLEFSTFIARRAEFPWIAYGNYVARLAAIFGAENILLLPYEKEQMPDGPLAAFCTALGIPPKGPEWAKNRANRSFSPLVSEFMRQLPLDQATEPVRTLFERACLILDHKLVKAPEEASQLLLPHAERAAILAEYEPDNADLARRYFGRERLFLAPLPDATETVASLTLPPDSAALMERIVGPFVAALIEHIEKSGKLK